MNTYQNNESKWHQFTLVEIMVALGMLMLMMSFLFTFVIGSQRLWKASEAQGELFDDAQLALGIIDNDLRNIEFSTEVGKARPFVYWRGKTNVEINGNALANADVFFFFSNIDKNQGIGTNSYLGCYPLIYIYDRDNFDLYRIIVDQPDILWESQGIDFTHNSNTAFLNYRQNDGSLDPSLDFTNAGDSNYSLYLNSLNAYLSSSIPSSGVFPILRNVSEFDFQVRHYVPAGTPAVNPLINNNPYNFNTLTKRPTSFQVRLGVFSRQSINDDEWSSANAARRQILIRQNERVVFKTVNLSQYVP